MSASASEALAAVLDALDAGRIDTARAVCAIALRDHAADAALWSAAGLIARLAGDHAEAERGWRRSLQLRPDPGVTLRLGTLLAGQGRLAEARDCFGAAVDDGSADAACHANRGLLRWQTGDPAGAEADMRHALSLDAGQTRTWVNLGVLLAAAGRMQDAEAAYRTALQQSPDDLAAHTNLGLLLEETRRYEEAERHQRRALALAPQAPEIHNHLAGVLARKRGAAAEAEAEFHYREAVRLQPGNPLPLSNLGALYFDLDRTQEAETALRQALALDADFASAHINLGQLLLTLGRLQEGWRHVEMRYTLRVPGAVPGFPQHPPPDAARRWHGEPLAGKRLLAWLEQGHGDQVQFCRYLAIVRAQQGLAHVTLACSPPLQALLSQVAGVDEVIPQAEAPAALERHDVWVPLLSLPLFCGTTVETIPADVPYLTADPARIARWAPRLPAATPDALRVGLVWRGNRNHDNDAERSLPGLHTLAPLWSVPGVRFVSLQKWAGEDEARHPPPGQPLLHVGSDIEDFSDTAAILSQLDLLVSVDTAGAHVAGALGLPCWVLLPAYRNDWRWLRDRDDTPWYPQMRLFRQAVRGDWEPVVEAAAEALQTLRQIRTGL